MILFARDSYLWWLTIAVALVGYLVTAGKPPTQWSYLEWLQFASAALATISGTLAKSPLPSTATLTARAATAKKAEVKRENAEARAAAKRDV